MARYGIQRWKVTLYVVGTVADVEARLSNLAHLLPAVEAKSDRIVSVTLTVNESTGPEAESFARITVERALTQEARVHSVRRVL